MHNTYFHFTDKLSVEEKAKAIKEMGFDGVFVFDDEVLDEAIMEVRKQNLHIEALHLPFKNCNHLWLDDDEGVKYTNIAIQGIKKAKEHLIPTVVFHISSKDNPPLYSEIGLRRIKEILKVAEELDINFALENLRRLDYLDYVYENIKSDKLKFCFDSGHANAFTKNLEDFKFSKYQEKLVCVHFSDNFGDYDSHLIPFMGNINWEKLAKKLYTIGFNGPLTSEAIIKDEDPIVGLKKIKEALDKIEGYFK